MTARSANAIPVQALIRGKWRTAKELERDGFTVTVLWDGRIHTLTEDDVRDLPPRAYTEGDE